MTSTRPTRAHLVRTAKRLRIQVPTMSTTQLIRRACDHYNARNPHKRPADPESAAADEAFVARICVNYLRHALSDYDANRDAIRRLTRDPAAQEEVGAIIKARTLVAIAETYPQLMAEARRQAVYTDRTADAAPPRRRPRP
ncbi:hypothetical protein [Gordonia sihwensis]|uniref:hypothetical protein n=1 Tax=Gordonia sihwensis TaxID=173559 RepID=UPI0005EDBA0F|nr:hypothetical protein [Gordonia sihwensis]KJR10464.1 hypothetical protein UG54_00225 [Gordonia sihwensis]